MAAHDGNDTIAATATSCGEAAIAIVRVSGPAALDIVSGLFRSRRGASLKDALTHTVHYGMLEDETGILDEALVTVMRAPRTYTRQDVVEIGCHGGAAAAGRILESVVRRGARLAEPGEFTKRAFLNGRIDLAQAEAVLDVIRAKTELSLRAGLEQLRGDFSDKLNSLRNRLLSLLASFEAHLDFGEEDVPAIDRETAAAQADAAARAIAAFIEAARFGRFLRDGARVVICGMPNVGKSSLLNAILKRERSIVTSLAGTTRDTVEELLDMGGIPVRLIDTAGLLKPANVIEKLAVRRSRRAVATADAVVLVFDGSRRLAQADRRLARAVRRGRVLAVVNKSDMKLRVEFGELERMFDAPLLLSARRGDNVAELEKRIIGLLGGTDGDSGQRLMVNVRQVQKLNAALRALKACARALRKGLPAELAVEELRQALIPLDEIVGVRYSDDLLDRIFSEFCIGK